jgi:hypothetical protein
MNLLLLFLTFLASLTLANPLGPSNVNVTTTSPAPADDCAECQRLYEHCLTVNIYCAMPSCVLNHVCLGQD